MENSFLVSWNMSNQANVSIFIVYISFKKCGSHNAYTMDDITIILIIVIILGGSFAAWIMYFFYLFYINHLKMIQAYKLESWCCLGVAALCYTQKVGNLDDDIESAYSKLTTFKNNFTKDY